MEKNVLISRTHMIYLAGLHTIGVRVLFRADRLGASWQYLLLAHR
jgi:hypothetical protein